MSKLGIFGELWAMLRLDTRGAVVRWWLAVGLCEAVACAGWRPPARDPQAAVSSSTSPSRVIANRPAVHVLPAGCAPAGIKFQCNPVTNAGCESSLGEACDDDEHGGFGCYPPPNAVPEGGECNDAEGPSCRGGLGCDTGQGDDDDDPDGICRPYCCSDADCGPKKCVVIDQKLGSLGFCT